MLSDALASTLATSGAMAQLASALSAIGSEEVGLDDHGEDAPAFAGASADEGGYDEETEEEPEAPHRLTI